MGILFLGHTGTAVRREATVCPLGRGLWGGEAATCCLTAQGSRKETQCPSLWWGWRRNRKKGLPEAQTCLVCPPALPSCCGAGRRDGSGDGAFSLSSTGSSARLSLSLRSQLLAVCWSCASQAVVRPMADFFRGWQRLVCRREYDGISGVMTAVSMATCRRESASSCCGGRERTELPIPSFALGMAHEKAMLGQGRGVCIKV